MVSKAECNLDLRNGSANVRIKGKSRLVKSVVGPTGNVLAEKLPVGAFCPRKLSPSKFTTRD